MNSLLAADECRSLAATYDPAEPFHSRIVMARHSLRTALYPRLAGIANRWNAGGLCASSMNRTKKPGSLVRWTCVKRLIWGWVLMPILLLSLADAPRNPCACEV